MTMRQALRFFLSILVLAFFASAVSAQIGSLVANWTVPAYSGSSSGVKGVRTLGDHGSPVLFEGFDPCRIVDTRLAPGPYGAPALSAGAPRNFNIMAGPCAGIASGAVAYSFNITVTNTQGAGFILIYPQGGSQPTVSTLNYVANQTIANAAVVPAGTGGGVTVIAGVSGTDLIIDINGYFVANPINTGEPVAIVGNHPFATLYARNQNNGGYSIWGDCQTCSIGVFGTTNSTGAGTGGVVGQANAGSGAAYGVAGFSSAIGSDGAGVYGVDSSGPPAGSTGQNLAGIRGDSKNYFGVFGQSQFIGVLGELHNSSGMNVAQGLLGTTFGMAGDSTTGPWGVFVGGTLGATGAKHFVEPHPSDASKVILYSSLEGREVGTYFRGTARTVNEVAVIEVPEDFRIVTDEEGLTVQLTPMGDLATLAVIRKGLDRIVVRSSKDVTFDYLIQGVRRAFKDFEPVATGMEFAPRSAEDRMPAYLTEEAKRRLIANGTYNADGTVNLETAERLGWAKAWREREEQARAAAAGNAATLPGGLAKRD